MRSALNTCTKQKTATKRQKEKAMLTMTQKQAIVQTLNSRGIGVTVDNKNLETIAQSLNLIPKVKPIDVLCHVTQNGKESVYLSIPCAFGFGKAIWEKVGEKSDCTKPLDGKVKDKLLEKVANVRHVCDVLEGMLKDGITLPEWNVKE